MSQGTPNLRKRAMLGPLVLALTLLLGGLTSALAGPVVTVLSPAGDASGAKGDKGERGNDGKASRDCRAR